MKYEITQGQYCEFLNTLSRAQQVNRVATAIGTNNTSVTNIYVMPGTNIAPTSYNRNGIACASTIPATTPVTFGCDYNANGIFNEADDGQWIVCNFTSWSDLCAYASWAGLRPMTELEFEKACRGPLTPVAGEYAWGSTGLTQATSISNIGTNNEIASNSGNGLCVYGNAANVKGPLRAGFATSSNTTRSQSGASYYGVMELSGNLWERPVSVMGSQSGTTLSTFAGTHGLGSLSTDGYATNSDWPGYSSGKVTGASGSGYRGGNWYDDGYNNARVSDRNIAAFAYNARGYSYGLRCVRTAS